MISVFFSCSTPHTYEQLYFNKKLHNILTENGISPKTLCCANLNTHNVVNALCAEIGSCCGLIAVAYERRLIKTGVSRNHANLPNNISSDIFDKKETSVYVHIETALAVYHQLPILVLCENGILTEGVLEDNSIGIHAPHFDLSNANYFDSIEFTTAINAFITQVKDFSNKYV